MTITPEVRSQYFTSNDQGDQRVIRLPPAPVMQSGPTRRLGRPWTDDEHDRFLQGLEMFPQGPWSRIAEHVGTRTTRQTMTHAQKYRQRIQRQRAGQYDRVGDAESDRDSFPNEDRSSVHVEEKNQSGEGQQQPEFVFQDDALHKELVEFLNEVDPFSFEDDPTMLHELHELGIDMSGF